MARRYAVEAEAGPAAGPPDIGHQLERLRDLKDGWADGMQPAGGWGEGHGKAPSREGLDWLLEQFTRHYPQHAPRPYIYPTPEGGVQAEWSLGPNEVSLEVDLAGRTAEWHCLNLQTNLSSERRMALDLVDSWQWIADEVRRLESMRE